MFRRADGGRLLRRRKRAGRQECRAHHPVHRRHAAAGAGMTFPANSLRGGPDAGGHFGAYGGRFVAETLMPLVLELEAAYEASKKDPEFQAELSDLLEHYAGRES